MVSVRQTQALAQPSYQRFVLGCGGLESPELHGRALAATFFLPAAATGLAWLSATLSPHGTFGNIAYSQMDALPIVFLLNFLLGFVMAYQAARQLEKYGANLYVADLVGISVTRELAPLMTAIIVAGRTRLRPILMTTSAMVLGALPLALAVGAGAEVRHPIGWIIVGGMTIGTLFTLFVVPCLYVLIGRVHVKETEDDAQILQPAD